jgi:hypothetical protein
MVVEEGLLLLCVSASCIGAGLRESALLLVTDVAHADDGLLTSTGGGRAFGEERIIALGGSERASQGVGRREVLRGEKGARLALSRRE